MSDHTSNQWEKKSERFEVRLPHTKKQAFVKACEEQGDTPSSAVRRFIDGYLKRADMDVLKMSSRAFGNMARRNWLPISAVLIFTASATLYYNHRAANSASEAGLRAKAELFNAYDKNRDGIINIGEISSADAPLHRVLNIDGTIGISLEEFRAKGKMQWVYSRKGAPITVSPEVLGHRNLVLFNLQNPAQVELNAWSVRNEGVMVNDTFDRYVIWGTDNTKPNAIMEDVIISRDEHGNPTIMMQSFTTGASLSNKDETSTQLVK